KDGTTLIYSENINDQNKSFIYSLSNKNSISVDKTITAHLCDWSSGGQKAICAVNDQGETSIVSLDTQNGNIKKLFSNVLIWLERVRLDDDSALRLLTDTFGRNIRD